TRRMDDCGVDHRPLRHQQPLGLQQLVDRLEQARRQIVLLQQVAKVEDRGLGGESRQDIGKTGKPAQALDVVEPVLHLAVRQGKPLLKKVDPQHRGQPARRTTPPPAPPPRAGPPPPRPADSAVSPPPATPATAPPRPSRPRTTRDGPAASCWRIPIGKTRLTQHSPPPNLPDLQNLTTPAAMANKSAVP